MSRYSSHLSQLVIRDGFEISDDGVYIVDEDSCTKYDKDDDISYNRSDAECWSFKNGLPHSYTGPAFIDANGSKEWWINGRKVLKEDWFTGLSQSNLKIALLNPDNF